MKKNAAFALILAGLVTLSIFSICPTQADSKIILVPDDYDSIQKAIDSSTDGDVIFIKKGTYTEDNLRANKPISLIGENRESTIINTPFSTIIQINSNNVTITGLTILTANGPAPSISLFPEEKTLTSIKLKNAYYCNITGNSIKNSGTAIWLYNSSNNIISANELTNNYFSIDITDASTNNTIIENTVTDNEYGIRLFGTGGFVSNNLVLGNYIVNNQKGLFLQDALPLTAPEGPLPNSVIGNCFEDNKLGIIFRASSNNILYHNNFTNNQKHTFDTWHDELIVSVSRNTWDNGTEGNYWSDYNGTDANGDGIGDTPYVIDVNNKDNYPIMFPVNFPNTLNLILTPSSSPTLAPTPSPTLTTTSSITPTSSPTPHLTPSPALTPTPEVPAVHIEDYSLVIATVSLATIAIVLGLLVYIKKRR